MANKAKILILYKSGQTMEIECRNFTVTKSGEKIHSVEWENAKPDPMFIGIDDIAAIYEIK